MPERPSMPWRSLAALALTMTAASCALGTPGPVDVCAAVKPLLPIDLTPQGWAALDVADPIGARKIDDANDWHDETCP